MKKISGTTKCTKERKGRKDRGKSKGASCKTPRRGWHRALPCLKSTRLDDFGRAGCHPGRFSKGFCKCLKEVGVCAVEDEDGLNNHRLKAVGSRAEARSGGLNRRLKAMRLKAGGFHHTAAFGGLKP